MKYQEGGDGKRKQEEEREWFSFILYSKDEERKSMKGR